jgi:WD40 repeat protein
VETTEGSIKFWDVVSGECLETWQDQTLGSIFAVAWSADGNRLVAACGNSTIKIWNVSTGVCEHVIQGKNHGLSVDWNPVNSLLAIAFLEQPIQLWDEQTREMVQTLRGDRPYEGTNITGVTGISQAQKATLKALGAIEI